MQFSLWWLLWSLCFAAAWAIVKMKLFKALDPREQERLDKWSSKTVYGCVWATLLGYWVVSRAFS